jgi:phosphoribosyl-AMP cyclohydrolase
LKGESSGHFQLIKNVFIDCDNDTILLQVKQIGEAACHTGHRSCFYRKLKGADFEVVSEKIFNPEDVYK